MVNQQNHLPNAPKNNMYPVSNTKRDSDNAFEIDSRCPHLIEMDIRSTALPFALLVTTALTLVGCSAALKQHNVLSAEPTARIEKRLPPAAEQSNEQPLDALEVSTQEIPAGEPPTIICLIDSTDSRYTYKTDKPYSAQAIIDFIQKDIMQRIGIDISRYDDLLQGKPDVAVIYPRTHQDERVMSVVANYFRARGYFTNHLPEEGLGVNERNMKLIPFVTVASEQEAREVVATLERELVEHIRQVMAITEEAPDEAVIYLIFNDLDTPGLGSAAIYALRKMGFVGGNSEIYIDKHGNRASRTLVDLRATYNRRIAEDAAQDTIPEDKILAKLPRDAQDVIAVIRATKNAFPDGCSAQNIVSMLNEIADILGKPRRAEYTFEELERSLASTMTFLIGHRYIFEYTFGGKAENPIIHITVITPASPKIGDMIIHRRAAYLYSGKPITETQAPTDSSDAPQKDSNMAPSP